MKLQNITLEEATKARLISALFTALFVLMQVGIVVAENNHSGTGGP